MNEQRSYDIKEAARHVGVPASTLRYWESKGLIRAGRNPENDYRRYSLHDLIEASEIAFYRKLNVPAKELESYPALSAHELDNALARTETDIEHRIAELEATRTRLAQQRALNAQAERLRNADMQPKAPRITTLHAVDHDSPELWKVLAEEPWRYGVFIDAVCPDEVKEAIVDAQTPAASPLWQRTRTDNARTCRECLLKLSPTLDAGNVESLFEQMQASGLEPICIVGSYLLTASEGKDRWDYYHAWAIGRSR